MDGHREPRRGARPLIVTVTAALWAATLVAAAPPAAASGVGTAAATVEAAGIAVSSAGSTAVRGTVAPIPTLVWRDCGTPLRCARALVPLDWRRPQGQKISLALAKLPATSPSRRIGTLFVNPGGPGASGVELMKADPTFLPASVRARFDVIGFDPRFVGESRPAATCLYDEDYITFASQPAFPVTDDEVDDYLGSQAGYAAKCAQHSYLRFSSTASVARDLELLRLAVKDRQLTYVGYSYGSYLGQVYAQLYPSKVRAMVLDGVLDAQEWATGQGSEWQTSPFTARIGSAQGSSAALGEFFRLCRAAGRTRCELARQGDPAATFRSIADELAAEPIDLGGGLLLDYPTLISATASVLYSPAYWQSFAAELQALHLELQAEPVPAPVPAVPLSAAARTTATSSASRVRAAARRVAVRARSADDRPAPAFGIGGLEKPLPDRPEPVPSIAPADNGLASFAAVTCSDTRNPGSGAAWAAAAAAEDDAHPYFGRAWTWSGALCATWWATDPTTYRGPFGARTATPLMVIGTTFDPATAYSGAVATARRFPGARLLTVQGYGHTSSAMPSRCVQRSVSYYLLTRKPPPAGAHCRQDSAPFR